MTAGRFREVDLDLLADYVGGALDGTPEQALVERLISTAPQWRDAHRDLVRAMSPVREALARLGAEQPAMPEDVTARLDAALDATARTALPAEIPAEIPADPTPAASPTPAGPVPAGPLPRLAGSSGPGGQAGPGRPIGSGGRAAAARRPGAARRRRWMRLTGPAAVAAAVVAVGVLGLTWLAPQDGGQSDSASTAGGNTAGADTTPAVPPAALPEQAPGVAGEPRVLLDSTPEQRVTSGTDYTPDTLPDTVADLSRPGAGERADDTATATADRRGDRISSTGPLPAGLRRLADQPAVLANCLAAVTAEHGEGQVTVQLLDYASFEGRPALVVVFVDGTGARWAWVSGPECGLPGSAADTRHRARVG